MPTSSLPDAIPDRVESTTQVVANQAQNETQWAQWVNGGPSSGYEFDYAGFLAMQERISRAQIEQRRRDIEESHRARLARETYDRNIFEALRGGLFTTMPSRASVERSNPREPEQQTKNKFPAKYRSRI